MNAASHNDGWTVTLDRAFPFTATANGETRRFSTAEKAAKWEKANAPAPVAPADPLPAIYATADRAANGTFTGTCRDARGKTRVRTGFKSQPAAVQWGERFTGRMGRGGL